MVPKPEPDHNRISSREKVIIVCVSLTSAIVGIAIAMYCIMAKRERPRVVMFDTKIKLSAREISRATMKYSDSTIIGRGGFSIVYKGVLRSGFVVAVKKLDIENRPEIEKSFVSESTTLGRIRHRNLVKIIGTLSSRTFKCLILEYISNGNLDLHLHSPASELSWEQRLKIALGVAHGLVYLHNETGFGQVLHCDLKPSNILLDDDFEPHISDFGISRMIFSDADKSVSVDGMQGSIGYAAPGTWLKALLDLIRSDMLMLCMAECIINLIDFNVLMSHMLA
jgi:LRR receptor-like serine/threonine-protein kinase FLS2